MAQNTEPQPPKHTPGPWSTMRDVARQILEFWDAAEPFDRDDSPAAPLMEQLAGPVAATDEQEAAWADAAPGLLAALELVESWMGKRESDKSLTLIRPKSGGYTMYEVLLRVREAIAKAES